MKHLAEICVNNGYSRLAWWVKNSNTSAIEFYKRMNADIQDDFTVRHLEGNSLKALARGI
jgi:ribosomal protein S18 acetylase RimI-like enzyme